MGTRKECTFKCKEWYDWNNNQCTEINTPPVATDWEINGWWAASKTFSMANVIQDAEDTDENLTIIITQQPTWPNGSWVSWEIIINWIDATFNMNYFESWNSYFKFKVKDSKWLVSDEEKRYDLIDFSNWF